MQSAVSLLCRNESFKHYLRSIFCSGGTLSSISAHQLVLRINTITSDASSYNSLTESPISIVEEMPSRRFYLAKYRTAPSQRAHFAIYIPDEATDTVTLAQDYKTSRTNGTLINVIGEPVMSGYVHQFKRNHELNTAYDLSELILLGTVDAKDVHEPSSTTAVEECTPRGRLEREAVAIAPPSRGQDVRAPIDGVSVFDE